MELQSKQIRRILREVEDDLIADHTIMKEKKNEISPEEREKMRKEAINLRELNRLPKRD